VIRLRYLAVFALSFPFAACGKSGDATPPVTPPVDAGDDSDTLMCDPGTPADGAPAPPASRAAPTPLVQWVDPMIGTGGLGYGTGSTFPGPQRPFGMVRPGPDTSDGKGAPTFTHCAGYSHDDSYIEGFSHTRMSGTGIADYGAVALMPTIGMSNAKTTQRGYHSTFSHATEKASPGYYAVTLADTNVAVEITATDHVGFHRYTFPAGADAIVLLDVGHLIADDMKIVDGSVTIDTAAKEVSGFSHFVGGYSDRFGGMSVFYVARFTRAFTRFGTWKTGVTTDAATMAMGGDTGAYAAFDASTPVEVAVGISFVDVAHARANLDTEIAPFDSVKSDASAAWEKALGVVAVEGRSDTDFKKFYTALYHSLLMPTLAMDTDGSYRGMDAAVHVASGFRYYTDFSLWDTYRSMHPLLTLLYPDIQKDMMKSLVQMANDGGYIDRWPLGDGYSGGMIGESAEIVFADSWAKGVRDYDLRKAYDTFMKSAMGPTPMGAPYDGRGGIQDYVTRGYMPIEAGGASAARTLDYAYDDWALAKIADALGETASRDALLARSKNWKNVYDASSGFLGGRHADGTFESNIPTQWQPFYAEGDAWQYTWYVPHDLPGLGDALGGRDATIAKLEQFFTHAGCKPPTLGLLPQPYYWAGNETDILTPWIFAALDDWTRTARWTRWVMATKYGDGPDGLPGNDDSGAMSSWFVFAASGLYPLAGEDYYFLGSPIFTRVTMHLAGGDFVVDAPAASDAARFVTSATLGGMKVDRPRVWHASLAGATLSLTMSTTPPT
jgi:predicted alpha-1,2-mannosidase